MFTESERADGEIGSSFKSSYPRAVGGARRSGDAVLFEVFADDADGAWLVGSFNGWGEQNPMERNEDGVFRTSLSISDISDGDAYKFKITEGGREKYVTDPYALEIDGYPNYNSVYRDFCGLSACDNENRIGCVDIPLNIYEIRDCRHGDGRAMSYAEIAQEMPPYLMQMGYTHIAIGGAFEEFYDHAESRQGKAYFAPRKADGGVNGFRELVRAMHRLGIGVILDLEVHDIPKYAQKERFLVDCCLYWSDVFGVDGFLFNDREILSLAEALKNKRPHVYFISKNGDLSGEAVDAIIGDCDFCNLIPDKLRGDGHDVRLRMISMAYNAFMNGKMITRMSSESPRLELYTSDLNAIYISCESLWRQGRTTVEIADGNGCICGVECSYSDDKIILLFNLSGSGRELLLPHDCAFEVLLDSLSQAYGGNKADDKHPRRERIMLLPLEAVVLKKIKE